MWSSSLTILGISVLHSLPQAAELVAGESQGRFDEQAEKHAAQDSDGDGGSLVSQRDSPVEIGSHGHFPLSSCARTSALTYCPFDTPASAAAIATIMYSISVNGTITAERSGLYRLI